jgi:hypothetical protein
MTGEEGKEEGMRTQDLVHPYFRKRVRSSFNVNRSELCAVLVTPSPKRIEKLPSNFCVAKKSGVNVEQVDKLCTWRRKPLEVVEVLR